LVNPGSNLLNRASRLIRRNTIMYYKYGERTQNGARQFVTKFMPGFPLAASVQAVHREKYVLQGLDLQKNYLTIFASLDIIDLQRDASGDQFVFNGAIYQIESQNSWFFCDGWAEGLGVQIALGNAPLTSAPV
jgi:hypothetical protein